MKAHELIFKFIGLWPIERMLWNWIKYQRKPSGEVDLHLGLKGFFTIVFMNLEDRDKIFEGGILPCLSKTVHATMEGKILPWKRKFQKCACMLENLLIAFILLAILDLWRNREQTRKIREHMRRNPKRKIHLLRNNVHRDGSVGGTPRIHKPGIQGWGIDTKH